MAVALGPVDDGIELGRDEPSERGQERDRGGLRERQPVELVAREAADALDHGIDALGGRRWPARPGARPSGLGRAGRAAAAPPRPDAVDVLAVVAAAQVGVAQPVVGDVDPLRELEGVGAGDVRVVLAQQAAPGEVDGLGAGVARDAERAYRSSLGMGGRGGMTG